MKSRLLPHLTQPTNLSINFENTSPLLIPSLSPPLDDANPFSHNDTSADDFVPSGKSTDSAAMSPKRLRTSSLLPNTAPQPPLHTNLLCLFPLLSALLFGCDAGLMFSETLSSLVCSYIRACCWRSSPIFICLCSPLSGNTTTAVNLVPTLCHGKNPPKGRELLCTVFYDT